MSTFSVFRPIHVVMSEFGQRGKATVAERAEVIRLRGEGVAVREVAARVFGDKRFRGRVERIIEAHRRAEAGDSRGSDRRDREVDVPELEGLELLRWLYERSVQALARRPKPASVWELKGLLIAHRQLEAMEAFERVRRLTAGEASSVEAATPGRR
jgi:hypothetical protein